MSFDKMSENQRIHPSPVTIPTSNIPSQKFNQTHNNQATFHSLSRPPKNGRTCCCRIICTIISILLIIIILIAILGAIFYFVFHPKVPNYSINSLRIADFKLNLDLSVYAKFNVQITAKNPNKKIGIYYENGGKMSVLYSKSELCKGNLPGFYQAPLNTTILHVSLSGKNQIGSTLMAVLQQQQQTGNIPLNVEVDQPVSIKLDSVKLGKVRVLVNCKLIVDSLSSNNLVSIRTSSCSIRVKL